MTKKDLESHQSQLLKAYEIRSIEKSFLDLFRIGEIRGTVHTCIGQELLPVMLQDYLIDEDYILSNHRGHGHFISWTNDIEKLVSELLGRQEGVSGGYGGSQHLHAKGFLSNGIQGGLTAIAGGIASSRKNTGIVINYIGDGTLGEGLLYESLNLCSKWNLPVVYVIEDNGVAQTTSSNQTISGTIEGRAKAFGVKYFSGDVRKITTLNEAIILAVNHTRKTREPVFLHVLTYRMGAHSKGDDNRDDYILKDIYAKDLINIAINQEVLKKNELEKIDNKIATIINQSIDYSPLVSIHKFKPITISSVKFYPLDQINKLRYIDLVNIGINNAFEKHPELWMIGEDIEDANEFFSKDYGGAFKASKGLSIKYPGRVRNTPISEAAIVGFGIGRALSGLPTIVEIMFGDFMTLVVDQVIQQASKIPTMFSKDVALPMILRTPMGGRRGYGPTHSQSIEKLIIGLPNVNVVVMNHCVEPSGLIDKALDSLKLNILIENKVLYGLYPYQNPLNGYKYESSLELLFPIIKISPARHKASCTIFTYGHGLVIAEEALKILLHEFDIFCEVICPTLISPLEIGPLRNSVSMTKKLLTVEEGPTFAALGSESIASLMESGITSFDVKRLGNNSVIPCSYDAEDDLLPGTNDIVNSVKELLQ